MKQSPQELDAPASRVAAINVLESGRKGNLGSRFSHAINKVAIFRSLPRYYQYSRERFHLIQFILLSLEISLVATLGTQVYLYGNNSQNSSIVSGTAAIFFMLLRLRLLDDLKDFDHDRRFYPDRPIARGLVSPIEATNMAMVILCLEVLVASSRGFQSLAFFGIAAGYSFFTFKEFFVKEWLRRHFTIYVLSHEILVVPVCFYLYSLNGLSLDNITRPYFWLLTAFITCQFFLLELTRKIQPREMEKFARDTYSVQYGTNNAAILCGVIALLLVVTGIIVVYSLSLHPPRAIYGGLIFLAATAFNLVKFVSLPDTRTAKNVFTLSAALVLATGFLFTLDLWGIA